MKAGLAEPSLRVHDAGRAVHGRGAGLEGIRLPVPHAWPDR